MLSIKTRIAGDGRLTLGVAGRLTAEGCDAMEQLLKDFQLAAQRVTIDLTAIRLVERPAIEYLVKLRMRGVLLVNLPLYVSRWMKQI
jgi:hypothetical protein